MDDAFILQNCGEEVLFFLKYEKYCAVLFFLMSVVNAPLILVYAASSVDNPNIKVESFLQRLTMRSIIDMATESSDNQNMMFLWATPIAFIFHTLL